VNAADSHDSRLRIETRVEAEDTANAMTLHDRNVQHILRATLLSSSHVFGGLTRSMTLSFGWLRSSGEHAAENLRGHASAFFDYPEDPEAWAVEDEYLFCDLLVAPVLAPSLRSRMVYLPEGRWKNLYDGSLLEGGQTVECAAPLDRIPVFEKVK
jgi:hypothetical protein